MQGYAIDHASEFKSVAGPITIDEKLGIVECFAAAIGNKDSVGDIIIPGAFDASLKRRRPRVVWGHDWNHPIGKVLDIYEVKPGDPRLPMKMKVAGVGGLYARVQFNLKSEKGREAFHNILFFDLDQEWCADPDTEILTDRGWLHYDEVTTDDRAYVLNPETGWGQFEQIQAVNIFDAKARRMRHIETGGFSSLTTAAHRWPIVSNVNGGSVQWTTTEELRPQDRILRAAPRSDAPDLQKYDDAFVEMVGWFWTEGWVPPADHPDAGLYVAQSTEVNPEKVASIRAALQAAFPGQWSEAHSKDHMARFRITRAAAASILAVTGKSKEPTPEFLTNLTRAQLRLLIETCLDGDGHRTVQGQRTWYQVSEAGVSAFEMLCALAGQPTNAAPQKDYGNRFGRPPHRVSLLKSGVAKPLDAIRVKNYGYKKGAPRTVAVDEWVETTDIIWCPTTSSGTWLARRNGSVYFTGNSIGYKTLSARPDPTRQANILEELELYEISPVLHGANQLTATISIKSDQAGNRIDSFRKSKWEMFDRGFAAMVKADHPDVWDAGGNIKGDDQYEILTKIAEQGGVAKTEDQIKALELREAWIARHEGDFLLPGVVAQMKWLAVGSRGQDHMKSVVREAIDKHGSKAEVGIPQEAVTGEVLRGRGPRRGGLERLLRYWRPIMKKPGGFRRCLVILADHPELYPLPNICAWLHHETTGKWPNEGNHHGSGAAGRAVRRLKKDAWYGGEKDWMSDGGMGSDNDAGGAVEDFEDVTDDDIVHAFKVLNEFMASEKEFMEYLGNEDNWEGEDEEPKGGCGCGCSGPKSAETDEFFEKVGRVLSNRNVDKIRKAVEMLTEVLDGAAPDRAVQVKADAWIEIPVEELFAVKSHLDPVIEFHGFEVEATESGLHIKNYAERSDEARDALSTALSSLEVKSISSEN